MIDIITNAKGAPVPQFISPNGFIEGLESTTLLRPDTVPLSREPSMLARSKPISLKKSYKKVKELDDINEATIQSLKKAIMRKTYGTRIRTKTPSKTNDLDPLVISNAVTMGESSIVENERDKKTKFRQRPWSGRPQ